MTSIKSGQNLLKKKKANNKKVAEYIADKRKDNKNYDDCAFGNYGNISG